MSPDETRRVNLILWRMTSIEIMYENSVYISRVSTAKRSRLIESSTQYMEIKCQLDATEVFIADLIACSTCFGHHYANHQELKSIIQWLLPVVFRAANRTHNPQLHTRPAT